MLISEDTKNQCQCDMCRIYHLAQDVMATLDSIPEINVDIYDLPASDLYNAADIVKDVYRPHSLHAQAAAREEYT